VELTEAAALFPNLESLSTCHCAEPWADGKLPSFEDMKSWYLSILSAPLSQTSHSNAAV
jgi:hypothetical protein